jgi:hypothetical protein
VQHVWCRYSLAHAKSCVTHRFPSFVRCLRSHPSSSDRVQVREPVKWSIDRAVGTKGFLATLAGTPKDCFGFAGQRDPTRWIDVVRSEAPLIYVGARFMTPRLPQNSQAPHKPAKRIDGRCVFWMMILSISTSDRGNVLPGWSNSLPVLAGLGADKNGPATALSDPDLRPRLPRVKGRLEPMAIDLSTLLRSNGSLGTLHITARASRR